MPGMDGFEMRRVLSNAPEMAQTTIVVVTGLDASAVTARGGIPKDIEVLAKPIPFDQLQAIAVAIATKKHLYQAQGKD